MEVKETSASIGRHTQATTEELEIFDLQNDVLEPYASHNNVWNLVDRKELSF
jgi:hypothetical protein